MYCIGILKPCIYNGILTDYIASSDGSIFNKNMKELKYGHLNSGYLKVDLYIDHIKKTALVHRLIAETFIPNPDNYPVVNHIDGDKYNNCVDNLEWVSYSYNNKHAYDNNLKISLKGKNSPFAKYSENDIHTICKYLEIYDSPKTIHDLTGLPLSLIKSIKSGLSWTNISCNYNIHKPKDHMSNDLRIRIKELYEKGYSISEIIIELNIPNQNKYKKRVRRVINRLEKGSTTIERN